MQDGFWIPIKIPEFEFVSEGPSGRLGMKPILPKFWLVSKIHLAFSSVAAWKEPAPPPFLLIHAGMKWLTAELLVACSHCTLFKHALISTRVQGARWISDTCSPILKWKIEWMDEKSCLMASRRLIPSRGIWHPKSQSPDAKAAK